MKVLMIQTYRNSVKELYEVTKISCKRYCLENNIDYIGINLSELLIKELLINPRIMDNDDNWYKFLLLDFINFDKYDYLIFINHTMMFQNYNYDIKRELSFDKNLMFLNKFDSNDFVNYNFIAINTFFANYSKNLLFLFEKSNSDKVNKYSYFLELFFIQKKIFFIEKTSFILQLSDDYTTALNQARQLTYKKLINLRDSLSPSITTNTTT